MSDSAYVSERLKRKWTKVVYAFYDPDVKIKYNAGRKYHAFTCLQKHCRKMINRYTNKADQGSTGNLRKHIKKCWGQNVLDVADKAKDKQAALPMVKNFMNTGKITTIFERKGKGEITYSIMQHKPHETRYVFIIPGPVDICLHVYSAEIVRWVCESLRPFNIVGDRGFKVLMKTGRPHHYLPSPSTVGRDVRQVFVQVWRRIANLLRVCLMSRSFTLS
jgi:hypothetical protein